MVCEGVVHILLPEFFGGNPLNCFHLNLWWFSLSPLHALLWLTLVWCSSPSFSDKETIAYRLFQSQRLMYTIPECGLIMALKLCSGLSTGCTSQSRSSIIEILCTSPCSSSSPHGNPWSPGYLPCARAGHCLDLFIASAWSAWHVGGGKAPGFPGAIRINQRW